MIEGAPESFNILVAGACVSTSSANPQTTLSYLAPAIHTIT